MHRATPPVNDRSPGAVLLRGNSSPRRVTTARAGQLTVRRPLQRPAPRHEHDRTPQGGTDGLVSRGYAYGATARVGRTTRHPADPVHPAQRRGPVDGAPHVRVLAGQRRAGRHLERLPGGVPFEVRRCGAQEWIITEVPEPVVARPAQQTADALPTDAGTRAAVVTMINGQSEPLAVGLPADAAHAPLTRQHFGVAARRQSVQRLALHVPSAASAVPLQSVLGLGVPGEHVGVEPEQTGAALLLAPRVSVMRSGGPPVRQGSQLTSHAALPIAARTQPLADALPRTSGKLAPSGLRCRAAMYAMRGPRSYVSMALPPLVVHGAPPPGTHPYRAVATLNSAGELVQVDIPQQMCSSQKEAP